MFKEMTPETAERILSAFVPMWVVLKVGFLANLLFVLYTVIKYTP